MSIVTKCRYECVIAGDFNIDLLNLLSIVTKCKYECVIAGDFNIDLLKSEKRIETEDYVNNLFAHSFVPPHHQTYSLQYLWRCDTI